MMATALIGLGPLQGHDGPARFARDARQEAYIRNHHAWIVAAAGADGRFPYNWFPHHNWANPRVFADFAAIDLRRITASRYMLISKCFRHDGDGGIERTRRLRGEHVHHSPMNLGCSTTANARSAVPTSP